MSASTIVRERAEGDRRWFLGGGVHIWKLTAEETGGAFFLFEDLLSEGKMTPLHCHFEVAETLYVLEGAILALVDGQERALGPGGVIIVRQGRAARVSRHVQGGAGALPADAGTGRTILPCRQ